MPKIERKITKKELTEKIGAENLALVLNNVYCAECKNTKMVGYEENIILEQSGDIILRGKCEKCLPAAQGTAQAGGHKVARLLETGEVKF